MAEGQNGVFLIGPFFFMICLLLVPQHYQNFPKIAPFSENKSIEQIVPVIYVDAVQAFALGRLFESYKNCNSSVCNDFLRVGLLRRAGALVNVKNFTLDHFAYLDLTDPNHGILHRLVGFISFWNVIKVVATILIVISIRNVIGYFLSFLSPIFDFVMPTIVAFLIWIKPVYEAIIYVISLLLLSQSLWYPNDIAKYIAFTGSVFSFGAFIYSSMLHLEDTGRGKESWIIIMGLYVALTFGIPATWYNSSFLGFLSCCGVYTALGFVVIPLGLGVAIGWDKDDKMQQTMVVNAMFLMCSLMIPHLKDLDTIETLFDPFRFGIHAMGTSIFLLGMLIISSKWYESKTTTIIRNGQMIGLIIILFYIGNVNEIPSFVNNAGVFTVLYGLEKYAELSYWQDESGYWILLFLTGCSGWFLPFYITTHPEWILGMFIQ